MNQLTIKSVILVAMMVVSVGMALTSRDVIHSKLFASLGLVLGALASKYLSK